MKNNKTNETGQILVILVVALVALLGLTSLAIDVGMIYSDRRYAQNAADAAALAGVQAAHYHLEDTANCQSGDCQRPPWNPVYIDRFGYSDQGVVAYSLTLAQTAAKNRAAVNAFEVTWDTTSPTYTPLHRITVTDDLTGGYVEVRVHITSTPNTSFMHLFYGGPVKNSVEGVARVILRTSLDFGNGIVALEDDPNCDDNVMKELRISGTGAGTEVNVENGGIQSNSCLGFEGNVVVSADAITYHYFVDTVPPTVSPNPTLLSTPVKMKPLTITCPTTERGYLRDSGGGLPVDPLDNYYHTQPGVYRTNLSNKPAIEISSSRVKFESGLYCIYGDFDFSGDAIFGEGVTIYMIDGEFTSNGGEVTLSAPVSGKLAGLLIYYEVGNLNNLTLIGNANTNFTGTIYQPGPIPPNSCPENQCAILVNGTAGTESEFNTSIIGYNVRAGGNGNVNINYDSNFSITFPANSEMYR